MYVSESRRYPPHTLPMLTALFARMKSTLSTYALASNLFLETKWCPLLRRVNSVSIAFVQDIPPGSVPVWTDAGNVKNLIIHSFTVRTKKIIWVNQTLRAPNPQLETTVSSNTAAGIVFNSLLMTCQVFIKAPDGSFVKARALLDSASSTSFISERIT